MPNTLSKNWTLTSGSQVLGNNFTGYLQHASLIPSNAWGLHIGCVPHGLVGSLTLGGYDPSRALGPVGVFEIDTGLGVAIGNPPMARLIYIIIDVESGGSPFNSTDTGNLLSASGDSSIATNLNPAVPYMFLPYDTCQAIAAHLPVTYRAEIGLYTWNTEDPRYISIITSPSQLIFTFQQPDTKNLTIKVPFALLNLALEDPLVPEPTPYFPCSPWGGGEDMWFLGRAFLQAVYIGMNWDEGKFFLAQAPGPRTAPNSLQAFEQSSVTMNSNPGNSYAETWAGVWKALPMTPSGSNPSFQPSATAPASTESASAGSTTLSPAAVAGIAVAAICLLLIALTAACTWLRQRPSSDRAVKLDGRAVQTSQPQQLDGQSLPAELRGTRRLKCEIEGGLCASELTDGTMLRAEMDAGASNTDR